MKAASTETNARMVGSSKNRRITEENQTDLKYYLMNTVVENNFH
jgi:hypothetical protein